MKRFFLFLSTSIWFHHSVLGSRSSTRRLVKTPQQSWDELANNLKYRRELYQQKAQTRLLQSSGPYKGGDPSCPCLSMEELAETPINITDEVVAYLGTEINYSTYGVNCSTHDLDAAVCVDAPPCGAVVPVEDDCEKTWCYRAFCYVDVENCALLNQLSILFGGRHYSYATCGEMDSFTSTDRINSLQGQVMRVGYTSNSGGWRGAFNTEGSFAENDQWTGPIVDLMNDAAGESGMILLKSTPPDWLQQKSIDYFGGSSSFDFCVYATSLGYLDMCIGSYTITDKRSAVTPFFETSQDGYYLVTFTDGGETGLEEFEATLLKIFLPFTGGAWMMIVFFVLPVLGLLMLFHEYGAPGSAFRNKTKIAITDPATGQKIIQEKVVPIHAHVRKSLYMTYLSFLAQTFDPVIVTAGGKVHLMSIASFLLLVMAVYTANLAAILTQDISVSPVSNLAEALASKYTFCATRSTANALMSQQGLSESLFLKDPVELGGDGLPGFDCPNCAARTRVFDAMSLTPDGITTCHAALTTLEDLQVLWGAGDHCNKTNVGDVLGYRSSGIPIFDGVADEMISFLYKLQYDGLFELEYSSADPGNSCPVPDPDEGSSLDIKQLSGIWLLTFFIAFVALLIKQVQPRIKSQFTKVTSLDKYDQWANFIESEVIVDGKYRYDVDNDELEVLEDVEVRNSRRRESSVKCLVSPEVVRSERLRRKETDYWAEETESM